MERLTHQRAQRRRRTEKNFLAGSVGKNALSTKMAPCPVGPLRGSLTQRGKSFKYLGGGFERITSEKAFQRPCMLVLENIISYKPTHNRTRGSHRTTVGAVTCLDIFHTQHTGTLNRFFFPHVNRAPPPLEFEVWDTSNFSEKFRCFFGGRRAAGGGRCRPRVILASLQANIVDVPSVPITAWRGLP